MRFHPPGAAFTFVDVEREKHLIVLVGPTAVGKTAVAIRLAAHFSAAIVSADSRQIFRELSIGTAKPDEAQLKQVQHHFISSHSIHEPYDAARYAREAMERCTQLFGRTPYVVLAGGSGLYVKALLEGFDDIPAVAGEIREQLTRNFKQHGIAWLQEQMAALDPDHLQAIDRQNPHRLIRALEVRIGTGRSIASFRTRAARQLPFNVIKIGLELPREVLYARIAQRMDDMIAAGLFEEAKTMYPLRNTPALQTVGYQEVFGFIEGRYDYAEAVRLLKRNTRHYAKRQLTWFKRDQAIAWFSPQDVDAIVAHVEARSKAPTG